MKIKLAEEMNLEEFKDFLKENLLTKNEAILITGQTPVAFNQSVSLGHIDPVFETEGKGPAKVKLYLKSQVEDYAKRKKQINKK